MEWLLTKTIEAGRTSGAVADKSLKQVSVDTTVMEKNIAHPTDARLYETARQKLVALAAEAGIDLRQSYARLAPRLAVKIGRYAHARQFKRMRKALRTLRGYTGRVMRDLRRQIDGMPAGPLRTRALDMLGLTSRLLHQQPQDKGKIFSLHEPRVDCISKGKARQRYEFGTKVSVAATIHVSGETSGILSKVALARESANVAKAFHVIKVKPRDRDRSVAAVIAGLIRAPPPGPGGRGRRYKGEARKT